jgi:hypothetical protein
MARRIPRTAQTVDELPKKNQQLLRNNQQLMGKIAFLRNNPMNSQIPGDQVRTLDYLTEKNQQLREKNNQLLGEIVAVRHKLVGPSEACTKVKGGKIIANITAWFF